MRVIAGACRGRRLSVPTGLFTRPTSDRVKESLFSMLTSRIDICGLRVIDICAGTGSLGIEALSRGAEFCSFIENSPSVKQILRKNIVDTGFDQKSEIISLTAEKALLEIAGRGQCYDLAFFDPPYASELYKCIPDLLHTLNMLSRDSILVVEHASRDRLSESYGPLRSIDRRVYGETAIELYTVEEV